MWRFPPFRLDVANQCLYRDDLRVPLMPKPFSILQYLVEHAGRLVTQDELLNAIWPETHVQPEVLRRYILEIRRVLGDQPETPRFIETITKRGYRFIGEVTAVEPEPTVVRGITSAKSSHARRMIRAAAALAVVALVGMWIWNWHRPMRAAGKDTIVLAELTNATGDPVFDGTLRQGLTVQIEQSPVLAVVSDTRIQETLRLMQRPPDARLTPEIAREVCRRIGGTIVLGGSIAQIGTQYNLVLNAVNCSTGELLATTAAQAGDKNHVVAALGTASSGIRKKLGESLANIQRFDAPLVQATTSSLDALQAYTMGYRQIVVKGDSAAAIPLLQRAIAIDPNFAVAYSTLGLTYWNLGESKLASTNIQNAFNLRAGLSEWEKLRIESAYSSLVTKDLEKARRTCEVWAQTYPRDWVPHNQLGVIHLVLGNASQAVTEYREALRVNPESGLVWANLALALVTSNRFDGAWSTVREAQARKYDSPGLRIALYRLGFLKRDANLMNEQLAYAAGQPGLDATFLPNAAATAAYSGHLTNARELYRQSVAAAQRAEAKEAAADHQADTALVEALYGNESLALRQAYLALRLSTGPDAEYRAAAALLWAGDLARAQSITENLTSRFPSDTIVQFVYLPSLRAQFLLGRRNPAKAIEELRPAVAYDLAGGLYPAYVRGIALLAASQSEAATREFQKILDNPGIVLNSPIGVLAHLQIARAYVASGATAKAREQYQEFLSAWKEADVDIPVLVKAKAEFANLSR